MKLSNIERELVNAGYERPYTPDVIGFCVNAIAALEQRLDKQQTEIDLLKLKLDRLENPKIGR